MKIGFISSLHSLFWICHIEEKIFSRCLHFIEDCTCGKLQAHAWFRSVSDRRGFRLFTLDQWNGTKWQKSYRRFYRTDGSETVRRHVFLKQFTDKIGDSSPKYLKTVHRQNNIREYQKYKKNDRYLNCQTSITEDCDRYNSQSWPDGRWRCTHVEMSFLFMQSGQLCLLQLPKIFRHISWLYLS